ncbi:hypothetical protein DL768_003185 [Monosporascus sp. mg162]|nr:hypothetical protein DL768_003185 [Monosporascus sp. mg162]
MAATRLLRALVAGLMPVLPLVSLLDAPVPSRAATQFTGDILHGAPVITHLSLEDVPESAVTRYYLRVPSVSGGWDMHLPVFVARGPADTLRTGKKLSVSASIHGDELNPVRVTQRLLELLEGLDCRTLNGTVIGMPTLNPTGNYLGQRNYYTASGSGTLTNVNRVFPGSDPSEGASGPEGHAWMVWHSIWGNTSNVDVAVDFHTATTGSHAPLWVYADFRMPYVERMAKLLEPDVLKIDAGEPGSIETTFVRHGIPAVTVELGAARQWNTSIIDRGVAFLERLLVDLDILPREEDDGKPYEPDLSRTFTGNVFHGLVSRFGGFVEPLVDVLDEVVAGQPVAHIRNAWGDVLETVYSPVTARVFQVPSDAATEPGRDAVQLVYYSTDIPGCEAGCIISSRDAAAPRRK